MVRYTLIGWSYNQNDPCMEEQSAWLKNVGGGQKCILGIVIFLISRGNDVGIYGIEIYGIGVILKYLGPHESDYME